MGILPELWDYVKQFNTQEEVNNEMAKVDEELSKLKINEFNSTLSKKKVALFNYKRVLEQEKLLKAYEEIERKQKNAT